MTADSLISAFGTADGQLTVGGIAIGRLAEIAGATPFFAYDRSQITHRVQYLRDMLPSSVEIAYAVKANPMVAVVQHLAQYVDSFDVASRGEMRIALDTPIPSARISFAGPGKADSEIAQAVSAGVLIEIESCNEARRIADAAQRSGVRPPVALRVNPDFHIKGSGMHMGGGPQQFGVDREQAPALLFELGKMDLDFRGFHVFAGSQNLNAEILAEAQERTVDLVLSLEPHCPAPVRYLNIGGGFGIPYFKQDRPLDLSILGRRMSDLIDRTVRTRLPHARIVVELGRYIVGESGVYVTRVLDRKESRGRRFLVVDGGLHHQLAASGNFGQVVRRNYPIAIGSKILEASRVATTVVGCLCTPLDLLGNNVLLPDADVGDLVVIFMAGAYGLTASPVNFLGHPVPIEILV